MNPSRAIMSPAVKDSSTCFCMYPSSRRINTGISNTALFSDTGSDHFRPRPPPSLPLEVILTALCSHRRRQVKKLALDRYAQTNCGHHSQPLPRETEKSKYITFLSEARDMFQEPVVIPLILPLCKQTGISIYFFLSEMR